MILLTFVLIYSLSRCDKTRVEWKRRQALKVRDHNLPRFWFYDPRKTWQHFWSGTRLQGAAESHAASSKGVALSQSLRKSLQQKRERVGGEEDRATQSKSKPTRQRVQWAWVYCWVFLSFSVVSIKAPASTTQLHTPSPHLSLLQQSGKFVAVGEVVVALETDACCLSSSHLFFFFSVQLFFSTMSCQLTEHFTIAAACKFTSRAATNDCFSNRLFCHSGD